MGFHRANLPQLGGKLCTTDAGIETYMMYSKGLELRNFSLFELLDDKAAVAAVEGYFRRLIEAALSHKAGIVLDGWEYRASRDWGDLLGYSREAMAEFVARSAAFFQALAKEYETADSPMPISGMLGPRGDAYKVERVITAAEAEDYHAEQIGAAAKAGVDLITGLTLSIPDEAIGIARAAKAAGVPSVISFTLDGSGRLSTGPSLGEAIEAVDAATGAAPAYYMINCSHPVDFAPALEAGSGWISRVLGLRANASSLEKGALCQLGHLEAGDPVELGGQMADMARRFPHMTVFGGCCGTDWRHIGEITRQVAEVRRAPVAA